MRASTEACELCDRTERLPGWRRHGRPEVNPAQPVGRTPRGSAESRSGQPRRVSEPGAARPAAQQVVPKPRCRPRCPGRLTAARCRPRPTPSSFARPRRQGHVSAPAGPASSSALRQAGQPRQRRHSELPLRRTGAGAPRPARGRDHRRVDKPLAKGLWPQRSRVGSSSGDRLPSSTTDGDPRRRSSPPRRRHPSGATVADEPLASTTMLTAVGG
jgi:hypothetical protein